MTKERAKELNREFIEMIVSTHSKEQEDDGLNLTDDGIKEHSVEEILNIKDMGVPLSKYLDDHGYEEEDKGVLDRILSRLMDIIKEAANRADNDNDANSVDFLVDGLESTIYFQHCAYKLKTILELQSFKEGVSKMLASLHEDEDMKKPPGEYYNTDPNDTSYDNEDMKT